MKCIIIFRELYLRCSTNSKNVLFITYNLYNRSGFWILAHGVWKAWVLFEQERVKFWYKKQVVENETEITQLIFFARNFLVVWI